MADKKVVKKRTYTLEVQTWDDGTETLHRSNCGFEEFELLGLLQLLIYERSAKISKEMLSDIVKETVVKD